jgi:hypothetical protein
VKCHASIARGEGSARAFFSVHEALVEIHDATIETGKSVESLLGLAFASRNRGDGDASEVSRGAVGTGENGLESRPRCLTIAALEPSPREEHAHLRDALILGVLGEERLEILREQSTSARVGIEKARPQHPTLGLRENTGGKGDARLIAAGVGGATKP